MHKKNLSHLFQPPGLVHARPRAVEILFLSAYTVCFLENKKPQRYVTCVNNEEQQLSLLVARVFTETYLPHETRVSCEGVVVL